MNILDLCCGIGVAAVGLHRSLEKHGISHAITGIDIKKKDYPFHFIQGDVLHLPIRLSDYDWIWYSPPCQHWVDPAKKELHPDLITPIRPLLEESGVPYVIENVATAPLRYNLRLVGPIFGLNSWRERRFECSFYVKQPPFPRKRKG